MEDFQRRIEASFGQLNPATLSFHCGGEGHVGFTSLQHDQEACAWTPSMTPVFQLGDEIIDSSDDEEKERDRRRTVGGHDVELDVDTEIDETVGLRPSIAFSSQVDKEQEMDYIDMISLQDEHGESECVECRALTKVEEEEEEAKTWERRRPSELKPSLRRNGAEKKAVKRVSFTGLPEPKRAYVPPHKRRQLQSGSSCGEGTGSPANPSHSSSEMGSHRDGESMDGGHVQRTIPDYVVHPERYIRYELERPIIVGGGLQQLVVGDFENKKEEHDDGVQNGMNVKKENHMREHTEMVLDAQEVREEQRPVYSRRTECGIAKQSDSSEKMKQQHVAVKFDYWKDEEDE